MPIQTAEQFNAILEKIRAEAPDSAPHLPAPITPGDRLLGRAGLTTINYTDLEIKVDTVLGVLNLLKVGH